MNYVIPEISAQTILSSDYAIDFSEPTKKHLLTERQQEDCAIFYQAMKVLGKRPESWPCRDLYDVFVYLDFSGIFDRKPVGKVPADRVFSPEVLGVLDPLTVQIRVASFQVGKGEITVDEAVARYGSFE